MSFNFENETPIYIQIIELIKLEIIKGTYQPGEKIPSVRDLSLKFSVNPNTIQKGLSELENMELIYTERTNGKFVTNDISKIESIKKQTIKTMITNFFSDMQKIGLNNEEILKIINNKE